LILEGALNEGNVEQLAETLGLGSRQLRRLFLRHLGASPLQIANTNRVHLARKLIEESTVPMTEIAFHSGFKSIREYNHAVRSSTGHSPSELRRAAGTTRVLNTQGGLELHLPYRNPFDWKNLTSFLSHRAIPGVEVVTETSYQRTIEIGGVPGLFSATRDEAQSRLVVHLEIGNYKGLAQTVERIRRIFDLGADLTQIGSHLSTDPNLRPLLEMRPGLRVPGVWDGFEAVVLAVLGETLTTRGPNKVVTRLVQMFGKRLDTPVPGLTYLFPSPEVLAAADLSRVGITEACANTLRKLARFATTGTLDQVVGQVSDFTANYIAMRALADPDAFPSVDSQTGTLAERWRPWRAYAAMYIYSS
jgi:AraC family transcriptional regulator of adaptative response / DNA-3-methyladenine glycosylase II